MNRNFDQVLSEMLRLDEECRAHTTRIDEARKNNIELENELDEIEKRVAETTDTTAQLVYAKGVTICARERLKTGTSDK